MSLRAGVSDANESSAALLTALGGIQDKLAREVQRRLSLLEVEGGRVLPTEANLAVVSQIIAELQQLVQVDPEYIAAITEYLGTYDEVLDDVLGYMEEFGQVDTTLLEALKREYKAYTASYLLTPQSFNETLWTPMAQTMLLGVATGTAIDALATSAQQVVQRPNESLGALADQAATVVQSGPLGLERAAVKVTADALGVQFYLYQGRNIDTTRPFCKARAGKYWHRKEIEAWATEEWDGKVDGTNADTIFVHLGGWYGKKNNCRHILIPVPRRDVPREDLDRMIDKGLIDA